MSEKNESRDWELTCDHCAGSGHIFVERQVAERKSDVQEFKEECEFCEGRGFTIAFEDIPGIAEYVKSCRAPSAPGDAQDERQAFEAWLARRGVWPALCFEEVFIAGWNARPADAPAAGDARLLGFVREVAQQKPEKPDYWSSCGQCARNASDAEDLLDSLAAQVPQQGEA